MSSSSDKELEHQLLEAGNKLAEPPSSVDDLLPLLNQLENCLVKVEQSPSTSMQNALAPSVKVLVADQVFGHADIDVKVAVASCISEITRITAPDAPYEDDKMKDVFQLIVSSFENLADNCSRSYSKRTTILETVAKVRSCVVMLDLECDALIIEMFQHFLKAIRDYHPDNVFSSMETIMTLVLEESEDISLELLSPLLDSVKKGNEDVLPIARKLGEKVLECSAGKVKPYLIQAVSSLGISLDDYGEIIASICQEPSAPNEQNDVQDGGDENKQAEENKPSGSLSETTAQADKEMASEQPSPKEADLPKSPKSVVSNGVTQAEEDDSLADLDPQEKDEDSKQDQSKIIDESSNAEPDMLDSEKEANAESKPELVEEKKERKADSSKPTETSNNSHPDAEEEADDMPADKIQSEDVASSPQKDPSVEAAVSENQKVSVSQPSSPKALEGDAAANLEGDAAVALEGDAAANLEGDAAVALEGDAAVALEGDAAAVSSPSASGNLPDESLSKKAARPKKKEKAKESAPSDDVPQKEADVGSGLADIGSDLEEKPHKSSGRKTSTGVSSEDGEPMEVDESKKESGTASESEDKSLKQSSKKVDDTSNNADGSSLKKSRDKGQRSRRKPVRGKISANISDEADKEKMSSPKSAAVSIKDEPEMEETPKTSTKRKSAVSEKGSGSENYDDSLVGTRVKVWWPYDKAYYEGIIKSFDATKKKHKVLYNDGEVEILNLKREKWAVIADDSDSDEEEAADQPSPDATPEMPLKKKAKTDQPSKHRKVDASPKKGGVASSKSKSTSAKSSKKAKEGVKSDSKSPDDSRNAKKTEDVDKTKDHASKPASKSKNDDLKASKGIKSKGEVSDTPKASKSKHETPKSGKSKQDSSKVTSSTKGKSSKSGGKSDVNGSGKVKSSSSKAKETEDDENSMDSGETLKSLKGKSASSAKAQGSESKSSKKRRRA